MDQKFGISGQFYLISNQNMRVVIKISKKYLKSSKRVFFEKSQKSGILTKNGPKSILFSKNRYAKEVFSIFSIKLDYF